MKAWRCKGGHVLGWVARDGRGTANLLLLREALTSPPAPLLLGEGGEEEVDVMAIVVGRVVDVRCSICGRVRTWVERGEK